MEAEVEEEQRQEQEQQQGPEPVRQAQPKAHIARANPGVSPGPHYDPNELFGDAPMFGFGTDEQRKPMAVAKYPDSSVDMTCATVDSQPFKYKSTKSAHPCP